MPALWRTWVASAAAWGAQEKSAKRRSFRSEASPTNASASLTPVLSDDVMSAPRRAWAAANASAAPDRATSPRPAFRFSKGQPTALFALYVSTTLAFA